MRCAIELHLVLSLHQKLVQDTQGVNVVLLSLSANVSVVHHSGSAVLKDTIKPDKGIRGELSVEGSALVNNVEKDPENSLDVLLRVKILSDLPWVSSDEVVKGLS